MGIQCIVQTCLLTLYIQQYNCVLVPQTTLDSFLSLLSLNVLSPEQLSVTLASHKCGHLETLLYEGLKSSRAVGLAAQVGL